MSSQANLVGFGQGGGSRAVHWDMARLLVFVAALALAACGKDKPITIWLDLDSLSVEQRDHVRAAIDMWSDVAESRVPILRQVDDSGDADVRVYGAEDLGAAAGYHHWEPGRGADIELVEGSGFGTAAHEIGHALGLEHSGPNSDYVMYWKAGGGDEDATKVTEADADYIRKRY